MKLIYGFIPNQEVIHQNYSSSSSSLFCLINLSCLHLQSEHFSYDTLAYVTITSTFMRVQKFDFSQERRYRVGCLSYYLFRYTGGLFLVAADSVFRTLSSSYTLRSTGLKEKACNSSRGSAREGNAVGNVSGQARLQLSSRVPLSDQ